jgi:hypothetical protein
VRKTNKIKLLVLIAAIAAVGFFLLTKARVYFGAKSPSSVKLMLYRVELMTAASDRNPQVIFSNASGQEIDLTKGVDVYIGQAPILAGNYKRIRMTALNGIRLSIAKADDNPCGGDTVFTDHLFPVAEGRDLNSQVQIDFATHNDGGGSWRGRQITHFLLGPVTISENQPAQLRLRFNAANTLFCVNGAIEIRSPLAVWAETL